MGDPHPYYPSTLGKVTSTDQHSMTYIVGVDEHSNDALMLAANRFAETIKGKVLLFDQGYWQLSAELYQSVQDASWDDVILEPEMKTSITGEVVKFFNSRDKYKHLKVPWKRGIIYHGVRDVPLLCEVWRHYAPLPEIE